MARKPDLSLAMALAETAGAPRPWYGLGRETPGPLRLIVVRGAGGIDSVMHGRGPSWGAGFALPGSRTIVVRADAGDPERILRHELAHLALHEVVRVRVPLWFDEGYASVAAGEWDRLEGLRLNWAVVRGAVPGFFELDRSLRGPAASAEVAYALSASAVAMLARRNPSRSLEPLIGRLASGEGFDDAVLATTGSRLTRFEEEWQKDTRQRFGLIVWGLAAGFWLVIALLVVWVWAVRKRRDRPRRAALDQGWVIPDETEPPEPPPPLDEVGPAP